MEQQDSRKYKTGCRIKCVFVGDGAVGKTCMLISYTTDTFPKEYLPTVFENYTAMMVVDGITTNLELWDTAGQEGYAALRPLAYNQADVFVVCFDVTSKTSFDNVANMWVPELKGHKDGKNAPIILVGTKTDLRKNTEKLAELSRQGRSPITRQEGEKKTKEIGAKLYMECSALTQDGLKELFEAVVRTVIRPHAAGPTPGPSSVWCECLGISCGRRENCTIL